MLNAKKYKYNRAFQPDYIYILNIIPGIGNLDILYIRIRVEGNQNKEKSKNSIWKLRFLLFIRL